jgi:hypothetical protein
MATPCQDYIPKKAIEYSHGSHLAGHLLSWGATYPDKS